MYTCPKQEFLFLFTSRLKTLRINTLLSHNSLYDVWTPSFFFTIGNVDVEIFPIKSDVFDVN